MASNFNFKNFGNDPPEECSGGRRAPAGFPLARQASIYSLTFDEFQSTMGGIGKDLGLMNMDELLKNVWSAEEFHNFWSGSGQEGNGYLQRQGSLTLPYKLSHKTVDEVWRNMWSDGFGVPQRQPMLGGITIEEFLMRAGVVREDDHLISQGNNFGILQDLSGPTDGSSLGFGINQIPNHSITNFPLSLNTTRIDVQDLSEHHTSKSQQQRILPKQPGLVYGSSMDSPRVTTGNALTARQDTGLGTVSLKANGVSVETGSSLDGFAKSNGVASLLSPVPFVFNNSMPRGKRHTTLEKAVERRQRRMIKNRESAARSRARKQAYTVELEAEIMKLKEEQELLQKKQAKMLEMQKNQVVEMMKQQNQNVKVGKRKRLKRTRTGPW